ncbi:hypothetical protein DX933_02515 [Ornithinibacillus gellani]|uniref:hypothetical protein n=1 Tax=Ornithinibacillus gellani TaxID=2293253 RepID=UPI000F4ACCBA|nr:hypothetical protein [Ornithinibacillus gellani]TQS76188.1 hypothetical protein DX933_02515 [Ornithinibacillus gellani]
MAGGYLFDRSLLTFSINQTHDYEQKHKEMKVYTPKTEQEGFFKPKEISEYLGVTCDVGFAKGESNAFMSYLHPNQTAILSMYSKWLKAFRLSSDEVEGNQIMEPYDYFECLWNRVRNLFDHHGITNEKLLQLQQMYPHPITWEFNLFFVENEPLYGHLSLENLRFIVDLEAEFNIYRAGKAEKLLLSIVL